MLRKHDMITSHKAFIFEFRLDHRKKVFQEKPELFLSLESVSKDWLMNCIITSKNPLGFIILLTLVCCGWQRQEIIPHNIHHRTASTANLEIDSTIKRYSRELTRIAISQIPFTHFYRLTSVWLVYVVGRSSGWVEVWESGYPGFKSWRTTECVYDLGQCAFF